MTGFILVLDAVIYIFFFQNAHLCLVAYYLFVIDPFGVQSTRDRRGILRRWSHILSHSLLTRGFMLSKSQADRWDEG